LQRGGKGGEGKNGVLQFLKKESTKVHMKRKGTARMAAGKKRNGGWGGKTYGNLSKREGKFGSKRRPEVNYEKGMNPLRRGRKKTWLRFQRNVLHTGTTESSPDGGQVVAAEGEKVEVGLGRGGEEWRFTWGNIAFFGGRNRSPDGPYKKKRTAAPGEIKKSGGYVSRNAMSRKKEGRNRVKARRGRKVLLAVAHGKEKRKADGKMRHEEKSDGRKKLNKSPMNLQRERPNNRRSPVKKILKREMQTSEEESVRGNGKKGAHQR